VNVHDGKHRVFVVDDDEAVRDALGLLFRTVGLRVATFESAPAFLRDYQPGSGGCLVLDIRMPGMSGLDLQDALRKRRIQLPLVFLTAHGDVPMAVRALKRGAADFIEKPVDQQRLVLAVLDALRRDEQRHRAFHRAAIPAEVRRRIDTLTAREREVLRAVLAGRRTRQISEELCISIKTVEFHRARVREKLGVASLAELFRLFTPDPDSLVGLVTSRRRQLPDA
jgi:FixJ family two-component response regulator